ncbi:MAG: hypothetical protein R2852_07100 [Bacteroidia bacterium]
MTGTSKSILGDGFEFSNLIISGTITSTGDILVSGNLTTNNTYTASSGTLTMDGSSKVISGSTAPTFSGLTIDGTITTSNNFNITGNLSVSNSGSLTAYSGTATFNGTSFLSGIANLYNVTINSTRTLTLGSSSVLGIANTFTKTGTLNVTSIKPNTVEYNGSGAQTVVGTTYHNLRLANGGTKTPSAATTVNNDFTINSGVTFNGSSFVFSLYRHWNNLGTFTASTSDVQLRGTNAATITGATTFNTFTVNKSSQNVRITLANNVTASSVIMTAGNMRTGSNSITTTGTRTGTGIIIGTVIHNHSFTNGTPYAFEGPNNLITFTNPSGIGSVTVTTLLGEIADFDPAVECVTREYQISISSGTYTNATFRMHYENNELNAFSEPFLSQYRHNTGIVWDSLGFTSRDTGANYVELTGITALPGRYTGSGVRNLVRWNGSVSSAWNNASNWTTISGASMSNRVPNSTDAAQIGYGSFTNQPNVTTNQTISVLRFGDVQTSTLTVGSGGTLSTLGSMRGQWSSSMSHTIDVTTGTLNAGTDLTLSDGVSGHDIALQVGSGTVDVNFDLTEKASSSIVFTGSGTLNIFGDFLYTAGTFTGGSGTVVYKGGSSQSVAPVVYNNLTFDKTTEAASFNSPTHVNGNLLLSTDGEINVFDSLTVVGNITINDASTLINDNSVITVGGNWTTNSSYLSNNGTTIFNGSGAQTVNANFFTNFIVNKSAGTLSTSGDLSIDGDLSVLNGTLDLGTNLADRVNTGGILTIDSGAVLKIAGANNFPAKYTTRNLDANSTVIYDGTSAQSIRTLTYGHLEVSNGGSNAKTVLGNIRVNGNLTINSGATFNPDINTINLYGNLVNSGTFTPATSTLTLNGVSKTITGTTTLNNLSVINGSYTVVSGTISMSGDLTVQSTGSLNFGTNTAILDGDLTNAGTLISGGIATFTGTRVQTLQLLNAISSSSTGVVNFNGTVSPVINSTSSPTFATVNINNTGGITASVPWTVYFNFNVASGASFDGGPLTHTFYGNFTNNGTVLSSGNLKFSPGAPFSASGAIKLDGVAFTSTGAIEFAGTAPITITDANPSLNIVIISNTHSSGVTAPSSWTIAEELRVTNGATFYAGATTQTINGSILNNGTIEGQTSTFFFDCAANEINGLGTNNFYTVEIDAAGDLTLNSDIYVNRNFILDGAFSGDGQSVIFTGTTTSTISGSAGSVAFGDLESENGGKYYNFK